MSGLIAKLLAYWRAPRKTFVLLHPLRAAKFGLAYLAGRKLFGRDGGREPGTRRGRGRARHARRASSRGGESKTHPGAVDVSGRGTATTEGPPPRRRP